MYFLHRGFLDGRHGLLLAILYSYYVFLRSAKAWEISRGLAITPLKNPDQTDQDPLRE
jgi:hypothetical protein